MTALPLWARALAFFGTVVAVWLIVWWLLSLLILYCGPGLPPHGWIIAFLGINVFIWWRLWIVMVRGGHFWRLRSKT
jgi:hypothetical protein